MGWGTYSSISSWMHKDPQPKRWGSGENEAKSSAVLSASDNSEMGWKVLKTELWELTRNA